MGYLTESIAMAARSKRCQSQWGEHYAYCQQSIQSAMQRCSTHHTALIFGAGSLQDIPVKALSEHFEKVLLVDVLFLKSARKRVQAFSNIELIEADITESMSLIFQGQTNLTLPKRWLDNQNISLVVSLNLITQLPLLPAKWLMKNRSVQEVDIERLSRQVIQQHLDYLCAFSGVVCLIADRWDTEFDNTGQVLDEFDPWWEVEQPQTSKEWDWQVVPIGEGRSNSGQKNRVGVSFLNTEHIGA